MSEVGTIELSRRRSVWQIARVAMRVYHDYPWLFLVLAAAVIVPYELLRLAITGNGPIAHERHHTSAAASWALFFLDISLAGPIISALHANALEVIEDGGQPQIGRVARAGLAALPRVAVLVTITAALWIGPYYLRRPAVLYALAFFLGAYLWVRLCVVAQIAVVERSGVPATLRRSWRITHHNFWHAFAVLFLLYAVSWGVLLLARALVTGSGSGAGWVLLGLAVDTVIASVVALATAVLYFDLRTRALETVRGAQVPAAGAAEPSPSGGPIARRGVREWAAILLVLLGGLLFGLGWGIGVAILWRSPAWSVRQKLIGTFVVPGGLGFVPYWLAIMTDAVAANPTTLEIAAVVVVCAALAVASIAACVYLARSAARGAA